MSGPDLTIGSHMLLEARRPQRISTEALPRHGTDLRVVLVELQAANLENALSEMPSQRDMWREQAQRLAAAAQQ